MNQRPLSSMVSQLFGRFASKAHSPRWQRIINNGYVRLMRLDMREFADAHTYPTLNALFTRHFTTMRPFDPSRKAFLSPCDALVSAEGEIEVNMALQIKGMSYAIEPFLGESIGRVERLYGGVFVNLYLSPRDYHRYHAPCDMKIVSLTHIPGKLYPVNIPTLKSKPNLFIENERVVIECLTMDDKRFFLVLVGALNVGKMVVSFEPRVQTNSEQRESVHYRYNTVVLRKGDDFGCFQMGSTIVMLAEKGMFESLTTIPGTSVRCVQTIGTLH